VLVLDEIPNQTITGLSVVLIGWVRHPSHVGDQLFCFRGDVNKLCRMGHKVGE